MSTITLKEIMPILGTSSGIHHSKLSNVLELVRLLVKEKSKAIPQIGNDLGHALKFEPFKAYPLICISIYTSSLFEPTVNLIINQQMRS